MTDPHSSFVEWMSDGAVDEPPRLEALHASACAECLQLIAAFDALSAVDVAATPPPIMSLTPRRDRRVVVARVARWSAGLASAGVLVAAVALAIDQRPPLTAPLPSDSVGSGINEGVLGGEAAPAATASESDAATASALPSAAPPPAPVDTPPTPVPPPVAPPPPTPIATARPTPAPTAPPTPVPTPAPTAPPTPVPTPFPTAVPTPVPDDCADGVDNDDDLLIDLADPGCLLDGNEASA